MFREAFRSSAGLSSSSTGKDPGVVSSSISCSEEGLVPYFSNDPVHPSIGRITGKSSSPGGKETCTTGVESMIL